MKTTVELDQLSERWGEVLRSVNSGDEVVILEGAVARARIVPLDVRTANARRPGLHRGAMRAAADFDAPLPDSFWSGNPMKLLLDTHAFIWWDSDPGRLSDAARALIENPNHEVWLSVVSLWEMVIKSQLGKLTFTRPLRSLVDDHANNGLQLLAVKESHVFALENLPVHHKDPFDRLLIAQATVEVATVISHDTSFSAYGIPVVS